MGVMCQILINKTKEGFFKPDASVTGIVKYTIDKPTEYKDVTLSILGTGKCSWTESSNSSSTTFGTESSSNTSTTYEGTEEYIHDTVNLLQTKAQTDVLEGSYQYPFEFVLPSDLPSSHKDNTCTISYRIVLKFVKPKLFSFNKIFSTEIPVQGYIKTTTEGTVIFGLDKTVKKIFSLNKSVINVKAEVEKTFYRPGENINASVLITNNTDLAPNVRTSLYCYKTYTANCGRTQSAREKIRDCSLDLTSIPPKSVANLSQIIPTNTELYTNNSKVMRKEYKLRVSLKLPMPHKNEYVEMPVLIGYRRMAEGDAGTSAVEDAPPSYWEVMGEEQDKEHLKK